MTQLWLGGERPVWFRVDKFDARAATLADRHYSRQTVGSDQVMGPGKTLLMITPDENAVWGVVYNLDAIGEYRWRNSIFRNESPSRSSELVRAATAMTFSAWRHRYGGIPGIFRVARFGLEVWQHVATAIPAMFGVTFEWVPLTTEIDVEATRARRSKNSPPGKCYLEAGWTLHRVIPAAGQKSEMVVLKAPPS